MPETVEEKKSLLSSVGVSLWDVVVECDIVGSMDKDIKEPALADLPALWKNGSYQKILCNGATAYSLLVRAYPDLAPYAVKMPSTSPANGRFDRSVWQRELLS